MEQKGSALTKETNELAPRVRQRPSPPSGAPSKRVITKRPRTAVAALGSYQHPDAIDRVIVARERVMTHGEVLG